MLQMAIVMINRIMQLMKEKGLNRNEFAEKIGVQRSSITHILSGRNRPSLDFIEKLAKTYPNLNMNWLVTGDGGMFKVNKTAKPEEAILPFTEQTVAISKENNAKQESEIGIADKDEKLEDDLFERKTPEDLTYSEGASNEEIEKVIVFYSNKTFELYNPK
jgi:transcriptional regulator with XRE-family HTH domain